jgi:hypothetical protein
VYGSNAYVYVKAVPSPASGVVSSGDTKDDGPGVPIERSPSTTSGLVQLSAPGLPETPPPPVQECAAFVTPPGEGQADAQCSLPSTISMTS